MPHKRAKRSARENEKTLRGPDLPPSQIAHHTKATKKTGVTTKASKLDEEPIPKSAARILNAASIRGSYKKRKLDDDGEEGGKQGRKRSKGDGEGLEMLKLQPGETIAHFNKRVNQGMVSSIKSAIATSSAHTRKVNKTEQDEKLEKAAAKKKKKASPKDQAQGPDGDTSDPEGSSQKPKSSVPVPAPRQEMPRATEFQVALTSAPRRLNDIAQAPPTLTVGKLTKKKAAAAAAVVQSSETEGAGLRSGVVSMAQKLRMEEERENAIRRYRELKARRLQSS
ncbi:hypothetical protein CONPUDRAFT_90444 [Coniophora puteana RWD-64-598 SS2]|uniref:Uncharacterized protein n=1 Tax=Coniophora puteana (strain RWD-64-598) TaxID=741705 RepID=A0A5M3MR95_CONPW|nr:uncharacterized protein CONPUDRAFT_90444 [Coniophora puteana RWD-64-598 SS2]EIW81587.1 hypothetical protein CONPUDRAFT_90444 [Coniophora puteana RWD-64-598 SS2]